MVSIVALMSKGLGAEVATVGNEGMIGLPISWSRKPPFHLMAQLSGQSIRIPAVRLEKILMSDSRLASLLRTYSQAFFVQTAQNAACNGIHPISMRAARWLLATHDRAESGSFYLTQEFLAFMLGVARQSVGIAVGELAEHGLISYAAARCASSTAPASSALRVSATTSFGPSSIDCWGSPAPESARPRGRAPSPGAAPGAAR